MHFLNQSAFLKSLGWTLLNSFWQFGVLWLIFLSIISIKKNLSPQVKHGLAFIFLVIGFLWSAGGLSYQYYSYAQSGTPGYASVQGFHAALYLSVAEFLDQHLSYLSAVYLLVVAALFLKFIRYFYFSHKIQTTGLIKMKASLRLYVRQVSVQLGIGRKVNVWISQLVDTPIIVGFLRPTILIPVACMTNLTSKQLEAILLHELAHIKRNDYVSNLFIAVVEIIFFFNPFSRLFIKSIKLERENSCDDLVLQFQFERHEYASALLTLERNRAAHFQLAIASTGAGRKTLLHRIQRIMQLKKNEEPQSPRFLACLLTACFFTLVAFFNPVDMVVKNTQQGSMVITPVAKVFYETAPVMPVNEQTILPNTQQPPHVLNLMVTQVEGPMVPEENEEPAFDYDSDPLPIQLAQVFYSGDEQTNEAAMAVHREIRDFSKTDHLIPQAPAVAQVYEFPYVPNSSYSFIAIDTSKPKVKAESYAERDAREALLKAKKAIEAIDWEKIEQRLDKEVDLAKLKKEIESSLNEINWQQINEEVKLAMQHENLAKLQALRAEARDINQYKAQQLEFKKLQQRLEQEKEEYKSELKLQQLMLEKKLIERRKEPVRKKVIVNI